MLASCSNSFNNIQFSCVFTEVDVPVNYSTPVSKYNTYNSYASVEERPTVDSLLNELDNAHIYAVPNG